MKLFFCFLSFSFFMFVSECRSQSVSLSDFSFFQPPGPSWKLADNTSTNPYNKTLLSYTPGSGILVNVPDIKNPGSDLYSKAGYGDLDLELDYMMGVGSNSGIYLQGRYEIQLLDSWGIVRPSSGDNGGIYERWDDGKPEGEKGYDGHAPRQNASRGPGLWQHIRISFQAARFSESGTRLEKARIIRVELNGVTIQENVELSGPTRGAMENNEVARGPLRLQGDHGSVAFRNIRIIPYDSPRPVFRNLKSAVYKGIYETVPDYKTTRAETETAPTSISFNLSGIPKVFLMRFTGVLHISTAGEYEFKMNTGGGRGSLRILDKTVIALNQTNESGKISLSAGELPFELLYTKLTDYAKPALGLSIGGPGIREYMVSEVSSDPVDPILVQANVNTLLRSFSDVSDTVRITHAVNVGSPLQVHYTYDLDKGSIVQAWHGNFLDATPMWRGRGDGASRPLGMLLHFGKPALTLETLESPNTAWSADTAGSGYRPKGYVLDENDQPSFHYLIYQTQVSDQTRVLANGHGFHREIQITQPVPNLYARIALGTNIEPVAEGFYLVNDKEYYIQIDDAATVKPLIREVNAQKELLVPVQKKISYTILF